MKVTRTVKKEVEIARSNLFEVTVTRAARVPHTGTLLVHATDEEAARKVAEAVFDVDYIVDHHVNEDGWDWEDDAEIQEVTLVEPDAEIQLDAEIWDSDGSVYRAAGNEGDRTG